MAYVQKSKFSQSGLTPNNPPGDEEKKAKKSEKVDRTLMTRNYSYKNPEVALKDNPNAINEAIDYAIEEKRIEDAVKYSNIQQTKLVTTPGELKKFSNQFNKTNKEIKKNLEDLNVEGFVPQDQVSYGEEVVDTGKKVKTISDDLLATQSARLDPQIGDFNAQTDWGDNPAIDLFSSYKVFKTGGKKFYSPQAALTNSPELTDIENAKYEVVQRPVENLQPTKMRSRVGSGNVSNKKYTRKSFQELLSGVGIETIKNQPFVYENRKSFKKAKKENELKSGKYAVQKDVDMFTTSSGVKANWTKKDYEASKIRDEKRYAEHKLKYENWLKGRQQLGLGGVSYPDYISKFMATK